ncbi:hypothetical protein IWZ01DRAFT_142755 [Phyllosticta capitalensis]
MADRLEAVFLLSCRRRLSFTPSSTTHCRRSNQLRKVTTCRRILFDILHVPLAARSVPACIVMQRASGLSLRLLRLFFAVSTESFVQPRNRSRSHMAVRLLVDPGESITPPFNDYAMLCFSFGSAASSIPTAIYMYRDFLIHFSTPFPLALMRSCFASHPESRPFSIFSLIGSASIKGTLCKATPCQLTRGLALLPLVDLDAAQNFPSATPTGTFQGEINL